MIADTRKPFLEDDVYHFSISHCGNYAAAIVSKKYRVGVDIEFVSPRLKGIAPKFLTPDESKYLETWKDLSTLHLQMITLIWSAKEAMFKWYGAGNVDFRKHMVLDGVIEVGAGEWIKMPFVFKKDGKTELKVIAKTFDDLVLAYVVT